jgi:hypothetical protein
MTEVGVSPFNLRNILFQNRSIENMKLKAQIWSHQKIQLPKKSRWGTIFHRKKAYTTKGYQ